MCVEMAIKKAVEYELWILAVIAHLSLIGQSVFLMLEVQTDGVDTGAVVV